MRTLLQNIATFLLFFALLFSGCKRENKEASGSPLPTETNEGIRESSSSAPGQTPVNLPPGVGRRIKVANLGALSQVFNDSNYLQLEAARRLGIDPIEDISSAYFTKRPIVKITDNEYYRIDSLTHSLPFLVPEAATLLKVIGKNFRDSLAARGGDSHLIKVTSLLRTPHTVGRLRRVNVNATDSSTHQYATTFDISYTNFYVADSSRLVYQGDLKNLLAEVLYQLREEGKCLVKYERKTGCFHVTATR